MDTAAMYANPNPKYVLGEGPAEAVRLNKQYRYHKAVFGHSAPFFPNTDTSKIRRVLDVAAGTCAWALDVSAQPGAGALDIYACDISTSKFPPAETLNAARITTFQQDVTQPFPEDMRGTFDVAHMALLVYALSEEQWEAALKNACDMLGGSLLLFEADIFVYTLDSPPPDDGMPHDVDKLIGGPDDLHAANALLWSFVRSNGFVLGLTYRLRDLISRAGLSIVSRHRALLPSGRFCDTPELAPFREFASETLLLSGRMLAETLFKSGQLEAPKGFKIRTREEVDEALNKLQRVIDDGSWIVAAEWVATK